MTYPIVHAPSRRLGFVRQIINTSPGVYQWTISKDGVTVASNTEPTKADAQRVVRSTTNFLSER